MIQIDLGNVGTLSQSHRSPGFSGASAFSLVSIPVVPRTLRAGVRTPTAFRCPRATGSYSKDQLEIRAIGVPLVTGRVRMTDLYPENCSPHMGLSAEHRLVGKAALRESRPLCIATRRLQSARWASAPSPPYPTRVSADSACQIAQTTS